MSIEILVAPRDGWQQWDQGAVDKWFEENYDGEQVAKNVWWTYFIAMVEAASGSIEARWPLLYKFARECVLTSSETIAFRSELNRLVSEFNGIPATALRKVSFPKETEIPAGAQVTEEQIHAAMEKQVNHMRYAIENPRDFVERFTKAMGPAEVALFITGSILDGPLPKSMAELFELPLSSLSEVCERAIKKGSGVLCY